MTNKKGLLLLLSILILLILPFFILSFYIHPSADDYSFSYLVKAFGRWDYQYFTYANWSGRYFTNFIFSLNPLTFDYFIGYKIFPLVLLTAFVLSTFSLIFAIFKNQSNTLEKVIYAFFLILLYLNVIPSTSETIYWMDGSIGYFLPCIMTLLFLSIVNKRIQAKSTKLVYILIAGLLGFCICGCNEINMIFILEISGLILLYNFKNREFTSFIFPIFLVIIISVLLNIFSPGNYIRMTNYSNTHNMIYSFKEAVISVIKLSGIHFKSAPFIIITILSLPVLSTFSIKRDKPLININPWIASVILGVIIFSLFFPVSYSTGLPSPLRIYNTASVLFIIAWFYLIYLFIYHYNLNLKIPVFAKTLLTIACIIFFISGFYKEPGKEIYYSGNITKACYDIAANARRYNDELNNRYEIIRSSKVSNKLSITVPELSAIPSSIHFIDISDDTTSWINIGICSIFRTSIYQCR